MPRPKKDMKVLNIKLAKNISDQLEAFCTETRATKTIAVERFLAKCLNEYFSKPEEDRKLY
jgi:hypothetical protein